MRMCNTNKAVAALSEFPASIAGRCESGGVLAPPLFLHLVRRNEANPDCAIYILHNGQKSGENRLRLPQMDMYSTLQNKAHTGSTAASRCGFLCDEQRKFFVIHGIKITVDLRVVQAQQMVLVVGVAVSVAVLVHRNQLSLLQNLNGFLE